MRHVDEQAIITMLLLNKFKGTTLWCEPLDNQQWVTLCVWLGEDFLDITELRNLTEQQKDDLEDLVSYEQIHSLISDERRTTAARLRFFEIQDYGVDAISIYSNKYPKKLQDFKYKPPLLFSIGDKNLLNAEDVAVVSEFDEIEEGKRAIIVSEGYMINDACVSRFHRTELREGRVILITYDEKCLRKKRINPKDLLYRDTIIECLKG